MNIYKFKYARVSQKGYFNVDLVSIFALSISNSRTETDYSLDSSSLVIIIRKSRMLYRRE